MIGTNGGMVCEKRKTRVSTARIYIRIDTSRNHSQTACAHHKNNKRIIKRLEKKAEKIRKPRVTQHRKIKARVM